MDKTVWIVNSSYEYVNMFKNHGWNVLTEQPKSFFTNRPLVIQFTGGSDVDPSLYGERKHPQTAIDTNRDMYEKAIFNIALAANAPMLGICRGGQFLHVMNSGSLYQHVDGHTADHSITDAFTRQMYQVTSTHHQMMKANTIRNSMLVAYAAGLSTMKECYPRTEPDKGIKKISMSKIDIECLFYPETRCLCFQPHPEFDDGACQDLYFSYINEYIFNEG